MPEQNKTPNFGNDESSDESRIDTGGGAYVEGDVKAETFIGRDQVIIDEETRYDIRGLPNPYLGLRSFTYEDRAAFAGRESLIEKAVERITDPRRPQTLVFITAAARKQAKIAMYGAVAPRLSQSEARDMLQTPTAPDRFQRFNQEQDRLTPLSPDSIANPEV